MPPLPSYLSTHHTNQLEAHMYKMPFLRAALSTAVGGAMLQTLGMSKPWTPGFIVIQNIEIQAFWFQTVVELDMIIVILTRRRRAVQAWWIDCADEFQGKGVGVSEIAHRIWCQRHHQQLNDGPRSGRSARGHWMGLPTVVPVHVGSSQHYFYCVLPHNVPSSLQTGGIPTVREIVELHGSTGAARNPPSVIGSSNNKFLGAEDIPEVYTRKNDAYAGLVSSRRWGLSWWEARGKKEV
ncbi:hypothetical protein B0H14DRAFT_3573594 [Mycena olivaceomarginata]|nr:hypothetical protein B0H14DRAFT_3573594 [Mycena olivaceomarginata]